MLTIKHIIWNGSFETLYEAEQVRVQRPDAFPNSPQPAPQFISFDDRRGDVHTIKDGIVYVMNDTGKTVAKYDFGMDMAAAAKQVKNQISVLSETTLS